MKSVTDVISSQFIDLFLNEIKYYGYKSLVLNVVDAVYSISAKYESTLKVVERFAKVVNIDVEQGEYSLVQFVIDI